VFSQVDFGTSMTYKTAVLPIILQRLPVTAKIALGTVSFGSAARHSSGCNCRCASRKFVDFFAVGFALIGQSKATPWLAVLFVYIFAVKLDILPAIASAEEDT
jgi:ABC-type dipeptide/oligopeptide/nickel transport system permease component